MDELSNDYIELIAIHELYEPVCAGTASEAIDRFQGWNRPDAEALLLDGEHHIRELNRVVLGVRDLISTEDLIQMVGEVCDGEGECEGDDEEDCDE